MQCFFIWVAKSGYGAGVILSTFCVHTSVWTLKPGMQKSQQFRSMKVLLLLMYQCQIDRKRLKTSYYKENSRYHLTNPIDIVKEKSNQEIRAKQ